MKRKTLRMMPRFLLTLGTLAAVMLSTAGMGMSASAASTSYYVDSVSGSDGNSGTSPSTPWKTLGAVSGRTFGAGDTINFKRGSSWTGSLSIKGSGAAGNPITLKAYGTGDSPVISYPGVQWGHAIDVYGSYVTVQDFLVRDAQEAGIFIRPGASHVVVQYNEVTASGTGVYVQGPSARVTGNNIHDLKMIVNTSGGDDDYGAVGVWIANTSGTEVAYNRFINCKAPSSDYGQDGGSIELWGKVSDLNIHHNYATGTNGFVEAGGGSASSVEVSNNVDERGSGNFACLHTSGGFRETFSNFRIDNNTIVNPQGSYRTIDCSGGSTPSGVRTAGNANASTVPSGVGPQGVGASSPASAFTTALSAESSGSFRFSMGFAVIHDLIPDVVGEPLENEWHNGLNGDGLQQTTRGLLVWRKADNWTAFTDGSWTWVNGPYGIQTRSNDDRFPWEHDR